MKPKFLIATIFLLFNSIFVCFSHSRNGHRSQLYNFLFGEHFSEAELSEYEEMKFKALDCAAYLCIDQFNGYGKSDLNFLRKCGVKNLPSLDEIDYRASGSTHQAKTHRGWDFFYPLKIDEDRWILRKNILLNTGRFVFKNISENELNSLCALIYYMHILGDHEGDKPSTAATRMAFGGRHSGRNQPREDILQELDYHIKQLFKSEKKKDDYKMILNFIEKTEKDVLNLLLRPNTETTQYRDIKELNEQEYQEYVKLVTSTISELCVRIPTLIKNKSFYKRTFPSVCQNQIRRIIKTVFPKSA